ncbi:hypothetical protein GJ496_003690 [Pomphorhynchus laevis]|nr:hypothetical protein GJ496_003690 [Pomphorhynchus laevis]
MYNVRVPLINYLTFNRCYRTYWIKRTYSIDNAIDADVSNSKNGSHNDFIPCTLASLIWDSLPDVAVVDDKFERFRKSSSRLKRVFDMQTSLFNFSDRLFAKTPNNKAVPNSKMYEPSLDSSVDTQRIDHSNLDKLNKNLNHLLNNTSVCDETRTSELFKLLHQIYEYILDNNTMKQTDTVQLKNLLLLTRQYFLNNEGIVAYINKCLSLLAVVNPINSPGIRILSIDGGGIRGISSILILQAIEKCCRKPILDCFDYICGTSTGAILAAFLTVHHYDLKKIEDLYWKFGKVLFNQPAFIGLSNLLWNRTYYDTHRMESILRSLFDNYQIIDIASNQHSPRVGFISCVLKNGRFQPYVMRNYNTSNCFPSKFHGSSNKSVFEAVRASTSIPFFYKPVTVQKQYFADGGIVANNPVGIAIHESSCLWPDEPIHCVVSIGTGHYTTPVQDTETISIRNTIWKILDVATCSQTPHMILQDLLKDDTYFRFNVPLSQSINFNEFDPLILENLTKDTLLYMEKNTAKIQFASHRLNQKKGVLRSSFQKLNNVYSNFLSR